MLSNFHKITSEHWQRTPGTQKGSPISSKGARTKKKKKTETKDVGMETHPREGVVKEKFPHNRKPSNRGVCGELWNLREQHNWEKERNNTERTQPQLLEDERLGQLQPPAASGGWTSRHGLHHWSSW